MGAYMRNQFPFLGIKTPLRKKTAEPIFFGPPFSATNTVEKSCMGTLSVARTRIPVCIHCRAGRDENTINP
ncbi:hypothetical protein [Planococcus sp. ISL-109]|uniref:hypothetical protein n=1 Tax=Planococcus sp. ISL-109 TaxID=2819166 RepID=UPI002035B5A9|nr:hypothetical protein [Planococcus sp. ISL-109]